MGAQTLGLLVLILWTIGVWKMEVLTIVLLTTGLLITTCLVEDVAAIVGVANRGVAGSPAAVDAR